MKRASFKVNRFLDEFNFKGPGLEVNTPQIFELAACRFIEEKCNVLMVGPAGTGKASWPEDFLEAVENRPGTNQPEREFDSPNSLKRRRGRLTTTVFFVRPSILR